MAFELGMILCLHMILLTSMFWNINCTDALLDKVLVFYQFLIKGMKKTLI